jgi:hypothetical protein
MSAEQVEQEELVCKLTDQETLEYGQEQARLLLEMEELSEKVAGLNKKKKDRKERVDYLAGVIDSGEEKRVVECRWTFSWEVGEKTLVRTDTGEVVRSEPISASERQRELHLV